MLIVTMAIYFGRSPNNPGELMGGTISAIFGLSLFMDSLRVSVMPLGVLPYSSLSSPPRHWHLPNPALRNPTHHKGHPPLQERLGRDLPKSVPLPGVLATTAFLGVLVTYAEPAISSLRPLARLVDAEVAPYLYLALNQQQVLAPSEAASSHFCACWAVARCCVS